MTQNTPLTPKSAHFIGVFWLFWPCQKCAKNVPFVKNLANFCNLSFICIFFNNCSHIVLLSGNFFAIFLIFSHNFLKIKLKVFDTITFLAQNWHGIDKVFFAKILKNEKELYEIRTHPFPKRYIVANHFLFIIPFVYAALFNQRTATI